MTPRSYRRPRRRALALAAACAATLTACSHGSHPAAAPSSASPPAATTATPSPTPSSAKPPPVYPLTGLPVSDKAIARRPALSVKIDNIGAALPQAGLDHADLVTEALVEGGLTRLLATFHSHDAPAIGPIRSARPVDADLLRELNGGYFAYSGADPREIAPVKARSTALLISWDANPTPFWTDPHRVQPHWVFSSTAKLYAWGHRLRADAPAPHQLFAYSTHVPAGHKASTAHLAFSTYTTADWHWDAARHAWLRDQDGRPDVLVDGNRVSAANVVALQVAVGHTGIFDDAHNEDPNDIVVGRGPCWVFRDGRMVKGTWVRPSSATPVKLVGPGGHVIALRPGQTWLELLPRPYAPRVS